MALTALLIARYVALGTVIVFSCIVLALAAHYTNSATTVFSAGSSYYSFAAYSIAVAAISLILLPIMLAFGVMQEDSFPTLAAFELAALGILWVLWLAAGALSADRYSFVFGSTCTGRFSSRLETACRETAAITAFGFLNWLILLGYFTLLIVFATISAVRGHNGFNKSVMTTNFLAPKEPKQQPVPPQFTGQSGPYPPQQPVQYPQQQPYPPQQPYTPPPQGQPQYAPQYPPQNPQHPGVAQI